MALKARTAVFEKEAAVGRGTHRQSCKMLVCSSHLWTVAEAAPGCWLFPSVQA